MTMLFLLLMSLEYLEWERIAVTYSECSPTSDTGRGQINEAKRVKSHEICIDISYFKQN
jgi:hypothetical protein